MKKVDNLNRDYFGLEEKQLFFREFNYLKDKQIPLNAVIVDRMGFCYIVGKCEGISKHFTFGKECRVWYNDGTYKIFTVLKIEQLSELMLSQVPKDNFIYKIEANFKPKGDSLFGVQNPYKDKSSGICFNFVYDKSTLIECIFIPNNLQKYFKQNKVKSKKEIYDELYEAYLKADNDFDRALFSNMLKKLEESTKYYASIFEIGYGYENEYNFIKNLYEANALDWISILEELYYLPTIDSIYSLDTLQDIKIGYMKGKSDKDIIANLKKLKTTFRFSGIPTEPDKITNPSHANSFIQESELIKIKNNISIKSDITNYEDFLGMVSLFDSKMIKIDDFKELMNSVLNKLTFDTNKVNMMKDLLEIWDYYGLMHSVYSTNLVNISIFNGKKVNASLQWNLNYGNTNLESIKEFKVIDYKNSRESIESSYRSEILRAFHSVKKTKDIGKKSNLEIYKKIINSFDEVFIEIDNFNISFVFKDEILQKIFDFILQNEYFLSEILKNETFGFVDAKTYYTKLRVENAIFEIINKNID